MKQKEVIEVNNLRELREANQQAQGYPSGWVHNSKE